MSERPLPNDLNKEPVSVQWRPEKRKISRKSKKGVIFLDLCTWTATKFPENTVIVEAGNKIRQQRDYGTHTVDCHNGALLVGRTPFAGRLSPLP